MKPVIKKYEVGVYQEGHILTDNGTIPPTAENYKRMAEEAQTKGREWYDQLQVAFENNKRLQKALSAERKECIREHERANRLSKELEELQTGMFRLLGWNPEDF